MNVVITGSSCGMGLATTKKFLDKGHTVYGIDILPMREESILNHPGYTHYISNVIEYQLSSIKSYNQI